MFELAVSIQQPLIHPKISKIGIKVWVSSLKTTPNPSTLDELYWISDLLMMYLEVKSSKARGKSTGMPACKKIVMKIIIMKEEYYLYGLNWYDEIYAFICFWRILFYLSARLSLLALYFYTKNIIHTPIMSNAKKLVNMGETFLYQIWL